MSDSIPRPAATAIDPAGVTIRRVWLAILVLAAVLRLPGMGTDFWMDEIWSWTLVWDWHSAPRISGIAGIFTEIHEDNNNYLNSLFLYLCGPAAPLVLYRLPALLAGLLTVWLGGSLVARWTGTGTFEGLLSVFLGMGLLATSEVEVVYSSEARGYALAGCAAIAAQIRLGHCLRSAGWSGVFGYACLACIGLLSHLSFLPVLLAQGVWGGAAMIWSQELGSSRKSVLAKLVVAFGIPALTLGGLWLVDLRRTHVGGGPAFQPQVIVRDTLAMPFGLTLPEAYRLPLAVLFVILLLTGLYRVRRAPMFEIVGLVSLVILAPCVLFSVAPPGLVYPRHFLVSFALLIPVAGAGLAQWLTMDRWVWKLCGVLVLTTWCVGNGVELVRFWNAGRGQYQAALNHIVASKPEGDIYVGSDFDFRNGQVVGFYQLRSPAYQRVLYVPQTAWLEYRPDFVLAHDLKRDPKFTPLLEGAGLIYELDRVFPYAGPAGWHWGVYKFRHEASGDGK